jgi:hypothetical protein
MRFKMARAANTNITLVSIILSVAVPLLTAFAGGFLLAVALP